jgi:hypothetical protein
MTFATIHHSINVETIFFHYSLLVFCLVSRNFFMLIYFKHLFCVFFIFIHSTFYKILDTTFLSTWPVVRAGGGATRERHEGEREREWAYVNLQFSCSNRKHIDSFAIARCGAKKPVYLPLKLHLQITNADILNNKWLAQFFLKGDWAVLLGACWVELHITPDPNSSSTPNFLSQTILAPSARTCVRMHTHRTPTLENV